MGKLKKYILGILLMTLMLSGFSRGPQTETMKDKLLALPGVVSVEKVADNQSEWMPEKYIVIFEQQLDWSNPEAGTFEQRVEIGLHPDANVTVMETNGYSLFEDMFTEDDQPAVCEILDANYVQVKHRYMGQSYPDEVDNMSAEGWEYATIENEAGDYHHIFEALSTVLDGQWVCYGVSRGGRACLDYGRLYPEDDIASYIPYVAVNAVNDCDPGMMDFLYSEVGDDVFGKEDADQMRKIVLDFQVELMKNKKD